MSSKNSYRFVPEVEQALLNDNLSPELADDPLAWVMYAFPWGQKGTPLEFLNGPRRWQRRILKKIAEHCRENNGAVDLPSLFKMAAASGRGIGKSTLIAWLALWHLCTHLGSTGIITANSESQLRDRTFAELKQWLALLICRHWFEAGAMSVSPAAWFAEAIKNDLSVDSTYYGIRGQLWSDERPDSFAGVHNPRGLMVLFDEASGIPASIFNITLGFFTEPVRHRYWFVFGNPRRARGPFYDCVKGAERGQWNATQIDARDVEGTDPALYQSIIDKYGINSDVARVEVLGEFPADESDAFIARSLIDAAAARVVEQDDGAALVMGADVARYGADSTVIRFRQGRNGRVVKPIKLRQLDNMAVAYEIARLIDTYRPDAVFIDGSAAGVIDRLHELGYTIVHGIDFGGKPRDERYANKRTEMWADLRDWLPDGAIDDDRDLIEDLATPSYRYQTNSDRMLLEPKDSIKKRGFRSPDDGDALALTFAAPVARRDMPNARHRNNGQIANGTGDFSWSDDARQAPQASGYTQGRPTPAKMKALQNQRRQGQPAPGTGGNDD